MLKSSHVEAEAETKNLSKYLVGYLDNVIRPLVLMLPKLPGYTIFRDLNAPEDDVKCESFTIDAIDSFLAYEDKYYLQVYLT